MGIGRTIDLVLENRAQSAVFKPFLLGGKDENAEAKTDGIQLRWNFAFALPLPSKCRVCNKTYPPPPLLFPQGAEYRRTAGARCQKVPKRHL